MLTKIIITHDDAELLKTTTLWREAMELFLAGGAVSVILIGEARPDEIPGADSN